MKYYLGCSGWSYDAWKGPFYPETLENRYWLSYYSEIFRFVEIDSTFYRIPSRFMVSNWYKRTHQDFKFTVKFPKIITHENSEKIVLDKLEKNITRFLDEIKPLRKKILAFLIQLPPWLKIKEGLEFLKSIEFTLDTSYRYAVEPRHHSWFNDLAYHYFKNNNYCLVWSQQDRLVTPPVLTTDFVYLRLIGDRSIADKDFGKIQKDRVLEMQNWTNILDGLKNEEPSINTVIASSNNHYAGFGPATANLLAEMLDLESNSFPITNYNPLPVQSSELDIVAENDRFSINNRKKLLSNKKNRQTFISDYFKE